MTIDLAISLKVQTVGNKTTWCLQNYGKYNKYCYMSLMYMETVGDPDLLVNMSAYII